MTQVPSGYSEPYKQPNNKMNDQTIIKYCALLSRILPDEFQVFQFSESFPWWTVDGINMWHHKSPTNVNKICQTQTSLKAFGLKGNIEIFPARTMNIWNFWEFIE